MVALQQQVRGAFRAFRYRDFRYLFAAEFCYRIGMFMALTVLPLSLHPEDFKRPILLALLGAGFTFPSLILAPLSGVIVPQSKRLSVLRWAQVGYLLPVVVCGLLLYWQQVVYVYFLLLAVVIGSVLAFSSPVLSAFMQDIIDDPEDLASANGLAWSSMSLLQLLGVIMGGLFLRLEQRYWCFVAVALLHLAALGFMLLVARPKRQEVQQVANVVAQARADLSYLWGHGPILTVVALEALASFSAFPYAFQLPVLNEWLADPTPQTYAMMMGAGPFGAVIGGLWFASRAKAKQLYRHILLAVLLIGSGLLLLSMARQLPFMLVVMALMSFGMVMLTSAATTLIQTEAEESKRGSMLGIFMMGHIGMVPFGSLLLYGAVGEYLGLAWALFVGGVLFVAVYLRLLLKGSPRPPSNESGLRN